VRQDVAVVGVEEGVTMDTQLEDMYSNIFISHITGDTRKGHII
jgi:hypothetical protein